MTDFDRDAAHKRFAAEAFNSAWELLDLPERTDEQEEELLRRTFASAWHWEHRPDVGDKQRSVAAWQISRCFAVLGEARLAARFGRRSLSALTDPAALPFYAGFAHEAMARAAAVAGDGDARAAHLAEAQAWAARVADEPTRQMLLGDLATV